MVYEIPQELEYKEKIIFGLTFQQLFYAFIFFPISGFIFVKTNIPLFPRLLISMSLISLGASFMFLNLSNHLKDYYSFFRFRNAAAMSSKMVKFLGIKEIKEKKIILNDKNELAILKVESINFTIRNEREKESAILQFQKFLNSIDFSVQVVMNTVEIKLDDYLKNIKLNNKKFELQFEDYKKHLNSVLAQNMVRNRNFYLVIKKNLNTDLSIQVNICTEKLNNIGLRIKQLENKELESLLIRFFSNNIKDKEIGEDIDVNKDNFLHYLIAPNSIKNNIDYLIINNKYNRIITAYGYPRSVELGFLDKIITTSGDFDLSLHIEPFPIETTMINLNKELQKQRADLYSTSLKSGINPSLEIKYEDTKRILEELQKGKEKLFNISLYINCKADSVQELNLLTRKIEAELNSLMIIPRIPNFRMLQGLKSTTPLASNQLGIKRNITTEALSTFFPFTSSFLNIDATGIWLGLNRNNIPIIKDIFNLSNPNGMILATSGSGKSFFTKLFISRQLMNNVKVIVIDPQSEYIKLCERYNGQIINISRDSKTIINPLDLMEHDYAEKRLQLMDLLQIMLGGSEQVSEIQKAVLDKCLTEVYRRKGITDDSKTWNNKPPLLKDLLEELQRLEKRVTITERPTYRSLINRLSMYVDGVFSFLNQHTKIDFNNEFVVFNIGEMPRQVKPTLMFLILDYVYMKMRETKERKILVIDEAWSLLSRTEDADYIFEIVKTCRKFNLGLLLITQEVVDLIRSDAGNAVLANSAYTLLLRQKPAVIDEIVKVFHLSSSERSKLLTAQIGEGILILEDEHSELKVVASEDEHKIITTKPDELTEIKKPKPVQEQKEVLINVNAGCGFFKKEDLNEDEIRYLIDKGYVISEHVSAHCGRQLKYLLKPRHNESSQHFFLVKDIENYIKKFTDKINLYETVKPDIVFIDKDGKEIAIEVETGISRNNIRIYNKINQLKRDYDDGFIVLTSVFLKQRYSKYGKCYTRLEIPDKINSYFSKLPKKYIEKKLNTVDNGYKAKISGNKTKRPALNFPNNTNSHAQKLWGAKSKHRRKTKWKNKRKTIQKMDQ